MAIRLFLTGSIMFGALIAFAGPIPNKSKSLLTVKAKSGQGVYGLLRSYKLLDNKTNLDLFYKINALTKNESLVKNEIYKLPLSVYEFDGNSIRSSIGLKDLTKARQIEHYNQSLIKSDVKKQSFKQDKKIWAPLAITNQYKWDNTVMNAPLVKNNVKPSATIQKREDARKQILVASMTTLKPILVAERKMTAREIMTLEEKAELTSSSSNLATKVSSKSLSVPYFGDKYENVILSSNELANEVFYIVPGHGGPDPGAMAKNVDGDYTICEDEYAYDVSLRLAKNLMEKGATVYVIVQDKNDGIRDDKYLDCDCDEQSFGGSDIPLNQKKRLKQGISKVNKLYSKHKKKGIKKQWMVSLHIDAQSEESRQDVFFYYQSESEISKNKAIDIQKVFEDKYQMYRKDQEYSGTVSSRPLYVVRHSEPEPIFIELANIHNPEDRKRILYPKNRQLLADWITEGFLK